MMRFLLSLLLLPICGYGQSNFPLDPIQSLDFDFKNRDLRSMGQSIGDNRIVLLGEQDHGDAASMELKARVVKYLHEEKGFDVLLFESDFFTLQENNELSFAREQVQPFWSASKSMQPLWIYLQKEGMEVNGFAMGFNSDFARKNASDELKTAITKLPFKHSSNYSFAIQTFDRLLHGTARTMNKEERLLFYAICDTLIMQHIVVSPTDNFNAQFLYNVKAKAEHTWLNNYRVKHNTANLVWLLSHTYKKRKVIIWTANIHAVKDYNALIAEDEQRVANYNKVVNKDSVHTMAHALVFKHKLHVYSLVCISTSGTYTPQAWVSMNNKPEPIVIAEGNIEKQITKTSFLDLKKLPDATFSMIPVLHRTTFTANWREVFDGIVFISDQKPLSAEQTMMLKQ